MVNKHVYKYKPSIMFIYLYYISIYHNIICIQFFIIYTRNFISQSIADTKYRYKC